MTGNIHEVTKDEWFALMLMKTANDAPSPECREPCLQVLHTVAKFLRTKRRDCSGAFLEDNYTPGETQAMIVGLNTAVTDIENAQAVLEESLWAHTPKQGEDHDEET